ncbi:MAG: DinB family protein [Holophaga sp.]|nr:DinB family protein [Holophaga sp.]
MLTVLQELYAHQAWADARQWGAILGHEPARLDSDLFARLVHLHGAQHVWLARWQGSPVLFPVPGDFQDLSALLAFAQDVQLRSTAFRSGLTQADLERPLDYRDLHGHPWSQPLSEMMLHVALHSQYHRGQQATRLRALGAAMPPTDLVVWQRLGRPGAVWPEP